MNSSSPAPQSSAATTKSISVYRHYDLLYWWVVWAYAAVAAVVTHAFGDDVLIGGKALKVYSEPALGIGFVATLLFVVVFTAIRARGVLALVLIMIIIGVIAMLHVAGPLKWMIGAYPSLRVHMNLAFYVVVVSVLLPIWILSTFAFNRFHYYTFGPGRQVGDKKLIGGGSRDYAVHAINVHRLSDDIFVHRILGLWWLGGGTGDVEVIFSVPGGGMQTFTLPNVWRAEKKVAEINRIVGE